MLKAVSASGLGSGDHVEETWAEVESDHYETDGPLALIAFGYVGKPTPGRTGLALAARTKGRAYPHEGHLALDAASLTWSTKWTGVESPPSINVLGGTNLLPLVGDSTSSMDYTLSPVFNFSTG